MTTLASILRAFFMRTLLPALLVGPAVALALPPLEQLETRVELSPSAQLAERAYESTRAALSAGRIGLGVSAFGSVGYSHNHDIIDPTHSWSYSQGLAGGGLSMPVLGSRLQLEDSLTELRVQLLQLDARRQLERRELTVRLRKAYGDYWQAQRLEALAQGYLQDEPAFEHVAALRTRERLLLEGDRLELLTGFSLARRDEASGNADREVALSLMREITAQDLDGGVAVRPLVPLGCVRGAEASENWTESDPELAGLQQAIALRQSSPRDSVLYPVQSSVQLGYTARDDMPTGQHGGSTVLSWSFQVPVEYLSQRRLLARAAAAQLSRARLEYEVRRQELQQQRRELIARAAVLRRNSEFASARLASADAAVHERDLRAVKLEGDVAEQLQRARLQRYNAAKSLVEADKALVYWYADWARFETTPCQSTAGTAPPQPGATRPGGRALYLWHSAEWLSDGATELGERKFRAIHAAGIERLLISLDAAQMPRVSADPSPLAHIDPSAEKRPALLGWLAETLASASAASPWPVALSVHPRDLDVPVGDSSFVEVLHRLRISPTLMVYVANPDRAVEIAEPLLGRHPELSFSVALSLEQSLGRDESLWSYTESERRRRIERIEAQLAAANFSGLTLELEDAWRDAPGLARLAAGE
ncbi:MAG: hypothetical protein E6K46_01010 [Gammaproteobacteria bacterium]|nr:MAG: hypothetical protein E6K46_01010 [Gammaproteobacteria bacterium]